MPNLLQILKANPGIDRDGTTFSSDSYTDGLWCRFYRDLPRKIGGYTMLTTGTESLIRSLAVSSILGKNKESRVYCGRTQSLSTLEYSQKHIGQAFPEIDVTPPTRENPKAGYDSGFFQPYPTTEHPDFLNIWQFDTFTTNSGTSAEATYTLAHVAPNAGDVSNTAVENEPSDIGKTVSVFYQVQALKGIPQPSSQFLPLFVSTPELPGGTDEVTPPTPATVGVTPPYKNAYQGGKPIPPPEPPPKPLPPQKYTTPIVGLTPSGGIVSVGQFFFIYGSSGVVAWSSPGNLFEFPTSQVNSIAGSKIVVGKNTRGSGTSTVLFWSLTSVILGQYSPTQTQDATLHDFSWNTLRDDVSILSAACVVEYNQSFYWIGIDQFYVYTGVIQQLPNTMNTNWFFNNINKNQTSKVWGLSLPRYNEIWWFYPRGDATECTHAIIYNVLLNVWYDTPLSRSCGYMPQLVDAPLMADSRPYSYNSQNLFGLWQHETGTDQVYLGKDNTFAISSYFTTNVLNLGSGGQPDSDVMLQVRRFEPDFSQPFPSSDPHFINPMTMQLLTRAYAQSPVVLSDLFSFDQNTPYVDLLVQGGLVQVKISSNVVGGNYQTGKLLLTYSPGDPRRV